MVVAHFLSAGARRKAEAHLSPEQKLQAASPAGLALLVRGNVVSERLVQKTHIKLAGYTRAMRPREVKNRKPFTFKLGAPFIHTAEGPSIVAQIAQVNPKGFREPSRKAKKWWSTSLVEQVMKVQLKPEPSIRGQDKALDRAELDELVVATQDLRNIPAKYLSKQQRLVRSILPPLHKHLTIEAIREKYAKIRGDRDDAREKKKKAA